MSEKLRVWLFATVLATLIAVPAHAEQNYIIGHMSRVSYNPTYILITVDSGIPTNCTGTFSGWLAVTNDNKSMQAFVTGLWMRGDAADKSIVFYTSGIGASGFCEISQIDTQSAG